MNQVKVMPSKQSGYMDNQMMPIMIGAVLVFVIAGQIGNPDLPNPIAVYLFLGFATCAILFGYVMHLDSLSGAESPFNKHQSLLLMSALAIVPLALTSYRFVEAGLLLGAGLYALLTLVVLGGALFATLRQNTDG